MRSDLESSFERLEATRERVLRRLDGLDPALLNRPPARGGWSVLQVLHHVLGSETATLGYVRKKMQAGSALPVAGLASRLRLLALQVALVLPLRFKAPAATASVPAQVDPKELRSRWEEVRRGYRELLTAFPAELEGRLVFRHPFVGLMSLAHTLGFLQAHLDHHERQVERVLDGHTAGSASA